MENMDSTFAEKALNHLKVIQHGMEPAGGFLELRTFDEKNKGTGGAGRNMFLPVDADEDTLTGAVKWLTKENEKGRGVFIGVNPRVRESGSKKDVEKLTTAFLDLDIGKLGIDPALAIEEVRELSPMPPDLITNSGGGLHVLYFMQPTADYDNWRDLQETLYAKFAHLGADRAVVTDSARVLRLTPFSNWKYEVEDGGRDTEIVEFTARERRPSIASYSALFDVKPGTRPGKSKLPDEIHEGGTAESAGRNTLLFREAAHMRNRGYSPEEIEAALHVINEKRCVPPLSFEEVTRIAESAGRYEPTGELGDDIDSDHGFGYKFGDFIKAKFPENKWVIYGLNDAEIGMINAQPNIGKAQPLDAPILLANGKFTTMGDITVGDQLASVDGLNNEVYGVFPQGERPVYKVTFSDGRSTEADSEHLWKVHYRGWPTARIFTTVDLKTQLESASAHNRLWIDVVTGDFGSSKSLPLKPYTLGALLGDGGLTNGTPVITSKDPEVLSRVRAELPENMSLSRIDKISFRLSSDEGTKGANGVTNALRELGLMGTDSSTKFIPKDYLAADRETRLELLRGLMDTDGFVGLNMSMDYATASPQLAADVQTLARSLGAVVSISEKSPFYRGRNGKKINGKTSYVVRIRHAEGFEFVRLGRKKARLMGRSTRQPRLTVESIEYVGMKPTQCIAVTHPSHLYVTNDYIVTHNTTIMLNLAMSMAIGQPFYPIYEGGEPQRVMYMDFENRKGFLQRDLLHMATNFTIEEQEQIGENLFIAVDQEIYGSEMNLSNQEHLDLVMAEAVNHRADLIIIDTMAAAFTFANENDNSEAEKVVIKPLKAIARNTGAAILLVHHIGKAGETGDRSKLYAGRGASAFAAAARLVMNMEAMKDGAGRAVKNHVILSSPKVKGTPFEDTVFELDFTRRWFNPADIVLPDETSRQEQIWRVVTQPMKLHEIIAALEAAGEPVSKSTVQRALKLGIATGKIKKGASQGTYAPVVLDEAGEEIETSFVITEEDTIIDIDDDGEAIA